MVIQSVDSETEYPPIFEADADDIADDIAGDYFAQQTIWDISKLSNTTYHADYHPLHEIEDFMEDLAITYPGIVQFDYIGHTGEGREMLAMRLSKPTSLNLTGEDAHASNVRKMGFVITGAQHAREWIATSTALYLAHSLLADSAEDFALSSWLDYFDFYIIPVPNPDGYVYTWENDRLWYKNRQNIGPAEKCTGIDMNRNWGYKWKAKSRLPSISNATDEFALSRPGKGVDADPCSTWYPGHRPFEAPEVNNIANYIQTLPNLSAFIDLRSYGQMLSIPFSHSCKKTPKDAEDQLEAALRAVNAIKQAHGTVFTIGSLCEQLYRASGNVVDYMYKKAGIKYAYSVHLRDTGTYGFNLPAEWIRPVGEETAAMINSIMGFITKIKRTPPLS
ncbi:Zn-dependent exopeptidase [Dichomitus squalens]|nr:Zn-dependent exopeptidase [Dichomitus squalens]